uniref:Reverse transcriptase domain-containing protein n=1 Tax=Fundulus heteroclitus TaxID=8078 RepID=A0A3Q2PCB4_FUNHE
MNYPFSIGELKRALCKTRNSAPGKDEVCYIMLRHVSDHVLNKLLILYNKIWKEGRLPCKWKEAIVIPIKKYGKDHSNPGNYRPIALTSNMCKLMERMVNERLIQYLESRKIIAPYQSGFCRGRGAIDPVLCLEDDIRKAQINKETVVAVFFDVEKAYDMLWREGLMIKLHQIGIGGNMFNWLWDFLRDRTIQVKIGHHVSQSSKIENGTPQGSVVSPTLFSVMINDIFKDLSISFGRSLFADDGALWKRGRNIEHLILKLQEGIDKVGKFGIEWGFKFSIEKTKVMFFTNKKIGVNKKLYFYGKELERVDCFRFFGVVFDEKLTWGNHIEHVIEKSKKVLNIMRCLAGLTWGASFESLKNVYVSLIRSRIDYGSVVYDFPKLVTFQKLLPKNENNQPFLTPSHINTTFYQPQFLYL